MPKFFKIYPISARMRVAFSNFNALFSRSRLKINKLCRKTKINLQNRNLNHLNIMATNPIPVALPQLFALAQDAADGATTHGAAIGLVHNTGANISADLAAARDAETTFAASKTANDTASTALRVADSNARAFIKAVAAYFTQIISDGWTAAWEATGFPNQSPSIPALQDERLSLCASLRDYFLANPSLQITTGGYFLTGAKADSLYTAFKTARDAVNEANTDSAQKKILRDAATDALRARLRNLIAELGQLLDDTDPLWLAFGLNEPGAASTPDVPEAVAVTPGTPGVLHVNWAAARLAAHYRVWKQIVGTDANPIAVASPTDTEATLSGLPSGATAKITVTSVNDAGESTPSTEVTVTVP